MADNRYNFESRGAAPADAVHQVLTIMRFSTGRISSDLFLLDRSPGRAAVPRYVCVQKRDWRVSQCVAMSSFGVRPGALFRSDLPSMKEGQQGCK